MSRFLDAVPAVGLALVFSSMAACTVAADDIREDDRAVVSEGQPCTVPGTPIPDGWKVRMMPVFSVAAPEEGLLEAQTTPDMVEFSSREPGTRLAAFARRDLLSLSDGAGAWHRALGDTCTMTTESTTYLCDAAMRLHATCAGNRTVDVLLVLRHGAVVSASCEVKGEGTPVCARFLETLRLR
jgi:hypothetical protein